MTSLRRVSNPPNPWSETEVEYLDEVPEARLEVFEDQARSILSRHDPDKVGFEFGLNPYRGCQHACAYCEARRRHPLLGMGAGTDFDTKIVVKPNAPELLRKVFESKGWKGDRGTNMTVTNRLLIVVTNAGEYRKVGYRTGLWLAELTHFWDVAEDAGFELELVSPNGGFVPIDPESLITTELGAAVGVKGSVHARYEDRAFMNRLQNTRAVGQVDPSSYDAIYMTGGHGVMFDFQSEALAALTASFHDSSKVVSAVCHGPCGLLDVKTKSGKYLLDGKKATGFSWREEKLVKRDRAVPFSLEEEMMKRGADYGMATLPFVAHVVEDGLLITGQNPASARGVAEAVVRQLRGAAEQDGAELDAEAEPDAIH